MGNPFDATDKSIVWARDAIAELKASSEDFFMTGVTQMATEFEADTAKYALKIKLREEVPTGIARKATEALTTVRHAFDQATFAAQTLCGGTGRRSINYPWAENPKDMQRLLMARSIDKRLWEVFREHQPYPTASTHDGGNDLVRGLSKMANDKHTVGIAVNGSVHIDRMPSLSVTKASGLTIYAPQWDPEKNEAVVCRWKTGNVDHTPDYTAVLQVAFHDERLPDLVEAVFALTTFADVLESLTDSLKAVCRDI